MVFSSTFVGAAERFYSLAARTLNQPWLQSGLFALSAGAGGPTAVRTQEPLALTSWVLTPPRASSEPLGTVRFPLPLPCNQLCPEAKELAMPLNAKVFRCSIDSSLNTYNYVVVLELCYNYVVVPLHHVWKKAGDVSLEHIANVEPPWRKK